MARGGGGPGVAARSNLLLHHLRRAKGAESSTGQQVPKSSSGKDSCWWIPHPRTGIYFPAGHDWVMEDVPDGAATFAETCCFRNI
ncbi:uncharacterized protein [Cicer arietinum]|uniref:Uncharacterized protein LOC101493476 n=1 Tax=Cicer arietinum TaxID=3827 RepID=A0A1S2YX14_CICAR|nr:uncharacterized protein LOC101493476 [Cicer arietinum]